ncbi:MAG: DivIVA domain-containing protein [Oscillospiraceae bacterium]|nr:DivIVA domain-containing protein [Oscillospiraceae bacterium]
MLTPDKIKEKTFQTTGRGSYRSEDVDSFLTEVSASYERMFKENSDLIKKISILAKKVEEYRAEENSLKMALLNAQKLADSIVAEAKENAKAQTDAVNAESEKVRSDAAAAADDLTSKAKKEADAVIASAKAEAEKIVADANRQSNEILGNINRKVTHESLVYEMIQKEASEFKGKLVAMYKEHVNLINKLPELVDEKIDSEESQEVKEEVNEESEPVVIEEAIVPEVAVAQEESETTEPIAEIEEVEDVEEIEEIEEVDIDEPTAEEEPEEKTSDPQEIKKPFKLDLSKIDFASDADDAAPAPAAEVAVSLESNESDADDEQHMSFKSFFKKKQ